MSRPTRRSLAVALSVVLLLLATVPVAARSHDPFSECRGPRGRAHRTGTVACRLIDSDAVGAKIPFSYFVPKGCTPAARCPVVYLLHGFGGDHQSMLGTADAPSAFVKALTHAPAEDPSTSAQPWTMTPDTWDADAEDLRLVLVAPHGRTMPDGYGPGPGLDSFWIDWNPRYAEGGDGQAYDTPPPRFSHHLIHELVPEVEALLPVLPGPHHRALDGVSLGGYGSYTNGLLRPDLWASVGAISGPHNFLFVPGVDPVIGPGPDRAGPDADLPYVEVPSTSAAVPLASLPEEMQGFAVALVALGDPSADGAWFRGHMARDLALNARAVDGGGEQITSWRAFVNDAVPRRAEDFGPSYPVAQGFEGIVLPMNLEMDAAFGNLGVDRGFEIHPGIHGGAYWDPWLRGQLEHHAARLGHAGPRQPAEFDYRSVLTEFEVWGWRVTVERDPVEFLHLWDASCERVTLTGSGTVTVSPPPRCGAGPVTVTLGPGAPVDEPLGTSGASATGWAATVELR